MADIKARKNNGTQVEKSSIKPDKEVSNKDN